MNSTEHPIYRFLNLGRVVGQYGPSTPNLKVSPRFFEHRLSFWKIRAGLLPLLISPFEERAKNL